MVGFSLGCSEAKEASKQGAPATPAPDAGTPFVWTEVTPCPLPRFEALGAVVRGELWVMGGFLSTALDVTRRIDIYDPSSDAWRLGPDLPGAETHAGVANVGDDVVLVGGFLGNVLDRKTTAGGWRLSAANALWQALPDLPTPRAAVAMSLVGSELHAAGGLGADGNTDTVDHAVLDLVSGTGWTTAAALPVPRNHGGGAASGGLAFAVAGRHGWNETEGDDGSLEAFDPKTGAWQERAPMPLPRSEIGSSTLALSDGRIVTVGGSIPGKHPSDDVLVYDPRLDTWSNLPPLPTPLKGVVAARIGTKLVVSTGSPTSTDPSATTYVGCCL
jgi:N-acetylneuraminic acid mutarotase